MAIQAVTTPSNQEQFVLVLLAIFIPPLAICFAKRSIFNKEFLVGLLLTLLGHLPGLIFSLYYLLCVYFPERRGEVDGYTTIRDDEEHRLGGNDHDRNVGGDRHHNHHHRQEAEQVQGIVHNQTSSNKQAKQKPYRDNVPVGDHDDSNAPLLNAGDLPAYDDIVDSKSKKHHHQDGKSGGDNKIQI
ncbi:uncharacterized protein KGF55_001702 [Candida pseudojiufengensis]|uniref:uncharacterized protein n=1 Tax=Candida pseudojiufengensis TaxID=497109 RepID=UPI0022255B03|nr:uncharacterized protein KGF55_001702 [Candida pseudojiufengensis]KAI5964633.1 hypothetical protein KGF55_001702 [Candida pseudojiufengensis]